MSESNAQHLSSTWKHVCVRDVADSIQYGLTASAIDREDGPRFLRITDIQEGHVDWLSVPSCKISKEDIPKYRLKQGDIVFAKPGPLDPAFLAWGQGVIDRRRETTPEEAITEGVLVHGAIALLVHPELWLSQSFSLARIEQMVGNLSPQVVKHVVLEVGNWAGNIFLFFNTKREERVEALAYKLGLARLASTDFHAAWMIPMWSTQYKAIEATPQSFYQAIENRQTEPGEPVALSLVLYARLAYALFRASLRAYILNPIKRSLDTGNQAQEIGSVLPY